MKICARARGPLVVEISDGDSFELVNAQGVTLDVAGRKKILLCRCGATSAAPFCDGTHNRTSFEAPRAPSNEDDV